MARNELTEMKSISFTPEQLRILEDLAKKEERTFSGFIRRIAIEYAQSKGKLVSNSED